MESDGSNNLELHRISPDDAYIVSVESAMVATATLPSPSTAMLVAPTAPA
jgi:hypothetical protein